MTIARRLRVAAIVSVVTIIGTFVAVPGGPWLTPFAMGLAASLDQHVRVPERTRQRERERTLVPGQVARLAPVRPDEGERARPLLLEHQRHGPQVNPRTATDCIRGSTP